MNSRHSKTFNGDLSKAKEFGGGVGKKLGTYAFINYIPSASLNVSGDEFANNYYHTSTKFEGEGCNYLGEYPVPQTSHL